MADNRGKGNEPPKKKAFRWRSEMIQNLISFLAAYKSKMEYQAVDFDGDRAAQYKELRKDMAKLYEIEDITLFGPVSLSTPTCPLEDMPEEDKKEFLTKQKKENSEIQKGHQRIQEKVKEIRQNFSKAVTTGKRSGSGKLVYEFYDELVRIWGGYPSTEPLTCGIDSESLAHDQPASWITTQESARSQLIDVDHDNENLSETDSDTDRPPSSIQKRKAPNQVPKLIDNKRKHLEKTLSAAQRDKILLDEAKEDTKFRKNLSQCMSRSNESFTNAMDGVSSTLVQLGKSICQSVEMLSRAMIAQQQRQPAPAGGNHNIFYQNPNLYPPIGMPHGALVGNDEAEIGVQPNMTNLTPAMQSHYPRPGHNEQQRFY